MGESWGKDRYKSSARHAQPSCPLSSGKMIQAPCILFRNHSPHFAHLATSDGIFLGVPMNVSEKPQSLANLGINHLLVTSIEG